MPPLGEPSADALPGHGLTCFVIGPIGNRLAKIGSEQRAIYEDALAVMEEIILPACSSLGLEPVRADGLSRAGELTDQIFRRLRDDDIVIADLTGANANVMYELGLRHTRNKLTLQVGEDGKLPFDVNVIRTVMFTRSPHGFITARNELRQLLEAGIAGEWDPVSATRVWKALEDEPSPSDDDEPESDDGGSPLPDEPPPDDSDPGLVDRVAAAEEAQDRLLTAVNGIAAQLELLATIAEEQTKKMEASDARGLGMRGRLSVAIQFAAELDQIANNLALHVQDYVDAMGTTSAGWVAIVDHVQDDPDQLGSPEFQELGQTIRAGAADARGAVSGMSELVESMKGTAKYTKVLRPPTNRIADLLRDFSNATAAYDEVDRRLQGLGIGLPPPDDVEGPRSPVENG
jgi:hypothetical protein